MAAKSRVQRSLLATFFLGSSLALGGCAEEGDGAEFDEAKELGAGGGLGKADTAEVKALPVNGNFSATEVWEVRNQWEDTDTAAAREAGIAWPANSGLNWDEKYQAWVQSLEKIDGNTISETFELSTPWGKSIPAPKLDCADVALMMRASFAAWYNLPFFVVAFDGGTPVYFGHFGIRTPNGVWNEMPNFAQFADFSDMDPEDALADWPHDNTLRNRGVQSGDDQPMLPPGSRTGAYLDEIHLNKRAGRFIRLLLIFNGSMNLADSRNTYNLTPESIEAGDVMLWRWQRQGVGHTMFTTRVDDLPDGKKQVQSAFGNLPPNQPKWEGPIQTQIAYSDQQGGGVDEFSGEDYAPNNGGLKRFRVAKNVGGFWTNTFMDDDEASWINDTDHERMHRRPDETKALLGEVSPQDMRDALLSIIDTKREHLQQFPASCSARIKREEAFDDLYALMQEEFGLNQAQVDEQFRDFEDYVFAELVYEQSKTCCWNSTTATMYETIMDLNRRQQEEAGDACVQPVVFKAVGGDYDIFRDHNPTGWVPWSEDEDCPQRNVANDAEADHDATPFCEWLALSSDGDEPTSPTEEPEPNSCAGQCGGSSADGSCFCDNQCTTFNDCCGDFADVCG